MLYKSQTYTILTHGQNTSKDTAVKAATLTKANSGATINVR